MSSTPGRFDREPGVVVSRIVILSEAAGQSKDLYRLYSYPVEIRTGNEDNNFAQLRWRQQIGVCFKQLTQHHWFH